MDRIGLLAFAVICLSVWSGCNKASDPAADQSNTSSKESQGLVKSDLGSSTPSKAVVTFLNALRAGDEVKTAQMLTVMAREEMARRNLFPEPPGSDTAKFSIGETIFEPGDQDVAHVESRWNDNSEFSLERPEETVWEITWVLRREDSGWRIAGMATRPFADEPPLILNFEDPDDMQQKVERVDKELARRSEFPQTQNR